MANIELNNLCKSFGSLSVLKDINLSIEEKEFCVLVGPSGCGKSTLLRMIAGLESVTSGVISINGEDVTAKRPGERDLAMVFQSYALYPHKTVRDNLAFSLKMHHFSKDDSESRIDSVAKTLGLDELLHRFPAQLSGGQRQRVAMGRAMVRDPSVFLFDEPLSNLDAKLRVHMRTEIRDLHQRIGATSVYVTHDQVEAMTMADRIIVLNGGNIEQAGPPLELFDNPANVFVAGFLGSPAINLLEGTVAKVNKKFVVQLENNGDILDVVGLTESMLDAQVTLGIRPHNLFISSDGPIKGTVKVVEPTGVETLVAARYGDQEIMCQLTRQSVPKPNEPIQFSVDPAQILLFDTATGVRFDDG